MALFFYLATARQRDEAKRNRAEPGLYLPLSIKSPCNLYIFCYNKLIKGNRHRVVGQNLRKNLPSTANVTGKVFALCSFTYKT